MEVVPIPVLSDNYAYLLIDTTQRVAAAIDPVDADKVLARATELGVTIESIFTTHEHWDHSGGNEALRDLIASQDQRTIQVVGGQDDTVPGATRLVSQSDELSVGALRVQVFHTPCHTRGHVLYLCGDALFTGDTLFVAGCGRFFAGTPSEMQYALNEVVATLPASTRVFCGHEYTVTNLRFAAHVEPENAAVAEKLRWALAQGEAQQPTIPSTVGDELATNPFMRVTQPEVQRFVKAADSSVDTTDPTAVMGLLRAAKDSFGVGRGKI